MVWCEALVVTLIHRVSNKTTAGRFQGMNVRGDENASERAEKESINE